MRHQPEPAAIGADGSGREDHSGHENPVADAGDALPRTSNAQAV
jgi:hypothetical protein